MAAAWFIWRSRDAVRDQWNPARDGWIKFFRLPRRIPPPPLPRRGWVLRRMGHATLAKVFAEADFIEPCARKDWIRRSTDRDPGVRIDNPFDRLEFALESGKLHSVIRSQDGSDTEAILPGYWRRNFRRLACPLLATDRGASTPNSRRDIENLDDLIFLEEAQVIAVEREIAQSEFNPQDWVIEQVVGWIAYLNKLEFRSLGRADLQPPKYLGESYATDFKNLNPDEILKSTLLSGKLVAYSGADSVPFGYWLDTDIWSAPVRFRRDQDVMRLWKPSDPKSIQPVVVPKNMSDSEARRLYSELCTREGRQVSPYAAIKKPEFRRATREQLKRIVGDKIAPGRPKGATRLGVPKGSSD